MPHSSPRIFDRAETFVGWRYLYRRNHSPTVLAATVGLGSVALAAALAFLLFDWSRHPGFPAWALAVLAVACLQLFVTALFLNFFSGFTAISMTGVAWGVGALTVVLSVTSGFQEQFQEKVLGVNAHILVMKYGLDFTEWREVIAKVSQVPHVKQPVAPFVFNEMMIAHGNQASHVIVKGVQPDKAVRMLSFGGQIIDGSADSLDHPPLRAGGPALPSVLLGRELAKKLSARRGDVVRLISPLGSLDPSLWRADMKVPKPRDFQVTGIFYSGFEEYDQRLVYVTLGEAQGLLESGDAVTGAELTIDDIYRSGAVARDIERAVGGSPYRVIDWRELNHNLFTALRMQKLALGILIFLIILVAMFGVIATMTMLVIDKTREIAIIKSLGMRSSAVAGTFQAAGMTIGAAGTAAGLLLGLSICGLLSHYGYRLDPRVYLIDRLPVQVSPTELAVVGGVTLLVSFLATLVPSLRAAALRPVEGLRYE